MKKPSVAEAMEGEGGAAGHSRYRFAHRDKLRFHVAHHKKKTPLRCLFFCGAAGIRTRVQTGKPYAFYMLSLDLIFVQQLDQGHRLLP